MRGKIDKWGMESGGNYFNWVADPLCATNRMSLVRTNQTFGFTNSRHSH